MHLWFSSILICFSIIFAPNKLPYIGILISLVWSDIPIKQLNLLQKGVVTDYMFEKDRLFADFTLNSEAEFKLYSHVADILEKDIVKPDLVVYLQADTPRLMSNIKKRGRDFEKHVTQDYINQVNERYQEFFVNYEEGPLLIINTNNIDFVENSEDFDNLLNEIHQPHQGIKYFNPS